MCYRKYTISFYIVVLLVTALWCLNNIDINLDVKN